MKLGSSNNLRSNNNLHYCRNFYLAKDCRNITACLSFDELVVMTRFREWSVKHYVEECSLGWLLTQTCSLSFPEIYGWRIDAIK